MGFIGPEGRRQLQLSARFAAAGLELVIAIVVGYFGGRALDRWFGTEQVCSYLGLILGIIAGFRNLFLLARTANRAPPVLESSESETQPRNEAKPNSETHEP